MNFASGTISGHLVSIFALAIGLVAAGCDGGSDNTGGAGGSDTGGAGGSDTGGAGGSDTGGGGAADQPDVVEIAVRRLNQGQDVAAFEAARDAFVAELKKQPGVGVDREFQAVFDFSSGGPPMPPVYIGMTQYDDLGAFQAAGAALGSSPEAGAFFSTFTPELFTVLVPLDPAESADLASVADQPGQVLEVGIRNLSEYSNFDAADYAEKRDAFLALLESQDGVVREYQWVSPLDGNVAVGMTVYASQDAFMTIAQDPDFTGSPEVGAFLGAYPPAGGYVNVVVK